VPDISPESRKAASPASRLSARSAFRIVSGDAPRMSEVDVIYVFDPIVSRNNYIQT
jgi:hypothetical protein